MAQQRRIIKIHLEGGEHHEHIGKVIWVDPQESPTSRIESTKSQMVTFINANPHQTFVYDQPTDSRVLVGVVNAQVPYIRTYSDGEWQNNLLSLERY